MTGSFDGLGGISLYCLYEEGRPVVWEDGWLMEKDCWEEG